MIFEYRYILVLYLSQLSCRKYICMSYLNVRKDYIIDNVSEFKVFNTIGQHGKSLLISLIDKLFVGQILLTLYTVFNIYHTN